MFRSSLLAISASSSSSFFIVKRCSHGNMTCSTSTSSSSSAVVRDLSSLLSRCRNPLHIYQTHAFMLIRALHQDNFLLTQFILTCSSLGLSPHYSYSLFTHKTSSPHNISLYNTIIKSFSHSRSSPLQAISLYNNIQLSGFRPDSYTFPFVLKAVISLSAFHVGLQIHCQTIASGLESNVNVAASLVQMYSSFSHVSLARKLFDNVYMRDLALWNAMVTGYVKVGEIDNARYVFDTMPERKNVISWTALISGYTQTNRPQEAIAMFRKMQVAEIDPDEIAMLAVLSACAHLGALELGKWVHSYIEKHELSRITPLNNALIDMYAKSGSIRKALEVFENMKHRSIVTWTTMIAGLALHGLAREALVMFAQMEQARVRPNEITFLAILSACNHVGLVETGRWFFNNMGTKYGIEPKIEHYGCLIDLLARAGFLPEAEEMVTKMPFKANGPIWGSILAGCSVHGYVDLAERAMFHLSRLEPGNSGNYSLLCNTYSGAGRWSESGITRKVMRDKGVKKMAGGSLIEVDNKVYEFVAGRNLHFHGMIDQVFCKINEQSEKECDHELLEFYE